MNDSPSRRKVIAFVLSGIFPGLGQFYNRQPVKGAAFVVVSVALTWLFARAVPSDLATLAQLSGGTAPPPLGAGLLVTTLVLVVVWIWSLVDAWRAAAR